MPYIGWVTVGVFQGAFTFLMVCQAVHGMDIQQLFEVEVVFPAILSTALLLGSYPMTQVYQHEEDSRRGDQTISIKLGVLGTFIFTMIVFALSTAGFVYYYVTFVRYEFAVGFLVFLSPVLAYFTAWLLRVYRDNREADFQSTMKLNAISAVCLNAFFIASWWFLRYMA